MKETKKNPYSDLRKIISIVIKDTILYVRVSTMQENKVERGMYEYRAVLVPKDGQERALWENGI
jgi:hypothetical protein